MPVRRGYFRRILESELRHPADVYALCIEAHAAGFLPRRRRSRDFAALVAAAYRLAPEAPGECLRGLLSARACLGYFQPPPAAASIASPSRRGPAGQRCAPGGPERLSDSCCHRL